VRVAVVVQARTRSTRLPGKVLLPLAGKTLLERQIERISSAQEPFEIAVATTADPSDNAIHEAARRAGVRCIAGHPSNLLDRHHAVACELEADVVVKIPSDCPLIDPDVIDRVIARYHACRGRADYVSNLHPATYPDGNDVEVLSFQALDTAHREATKAFELEHTTPYIWERPERFRIENMVWETGLDFSMSHRFTVDYPEDYEFVKVVYEQLWSSVRPVFSLHEILALLEAEPRIARINERYCGVNWYRHHLHELMHISPDETRLLPEAT
jgi:spore coat polysaccharide biosynthesis protein SpsF